MTCTLCHKRILVLYVTVCDQVLCLECGLDEDQWRQVVCQGCDAGKEEQAA